MIGFESSMDAERWRRVEELFHGAYEQFFQLRISHHHRWSPNTAIILHRGKCWTWIVLALREFMLKAANGLGMLLPVVLSFSACSGRAPRAIQHTVVIVQENHTFDNYF